MNSIIMNFDDAAELNIVYSQLKKQYPKVEINKADVAEMLGDEYLLALALERKKNDNGVKISFEEHLERHGMTREELDAMEDVEIE